LLLAAFAAWTICVALGLACRAPLTSDEAAYALIARGDGESWLYRSRGVVAMARAGLLLGDDEIALRLVPTLASLSFVLAVFAVGRRAFSPRVGAASAAVLAGAHPFVLRGFELLGDVPAAACLLGAIAIVAGELAGESPPSYRLVGAAPLLAAAFYLRYGSAPVIALIGAAALACWWQPIRARPGPAIATAVVLAAMLAPFAIASTCATGSPIGILQLAGGVSGRTWLARGLYVYVLGDPVRQYGALPPLALVAALWSFWRPSPRRRVAVFLAIVALGQIVVLGIVSHPSPRFVIVGIALLVVVGVDALDRALDRAVTSARWRRVALGAVIASWVGCAIAIVPYERHVARDLGELTAAAAAIRDDDAGRPCTVVARALPQLMWYARCAGWKLVGDARPPIDAASRWYAAATPRRPIEPCALGVATRSIGPAWRLEHGMARGKCAAATR
jgi:4-amino-4-deoxy-L-arabinose transferase-like glycosyltransferase